MEAWLLLPKFELAGEPIFLSKVFLPDDKNKSAKPTFVSPPTPQHSNGTSPAPLQKCQILSQFVAGHVRCVNVSLFVGVFLFLLF